MDARKFAAEPLGNRRKSRFESGVAGDTVRRSNPVDPAHDEKRLAEYRGITAREEWLGHRHPRREGSLQYGEFLQPVETRGHSSRGGGAQYEPLVPGEHATGKTHIYGPIFLDGAAPQRREPGNLDGAGPTRGGEEPRQSRAPLHSRFRLRRRRARHRPR
jgi:hypothetical protein